MNKYIYLNNLGEVREFIDEFNPIFPNIPIQDRYPKEFLDQCLIMTEDEIEDKGIILGMYYDKEKNSFYFPESLGIEEEQEENIEEETSEIIEEGVTE